MEFCSGIYSSPVSQFILFYLLASPSKYVHKYTENNNTKKKKMTGYLQQHGQLLRAHKKLKTCLYVFNSIAFNNSNSV